MGGQHQTQPEKHLRSFQPHHNPISLKRRLRPRSDGIRCQIQLIYDLVKQMLEILICTSLATAYLRVPVCHLTEPGYQYSSVLPARGMGRHGPEFKTLLDCIGKTLSHKQDCIACVLSPHGYTFWVSHCQQQF